MNERINKISEEAEDWCHKNLGMPTPAEWNDKLFEKFAELIVRECINEINSVTTGDHGRDDWDHGYDAGLSQASETIKEHFGVQE